MDISVPSSQNFETWISGLFWENPPKLGEFMKICEGSAVSLSLIAQFFGVYQIQIWNPCKVKSWSLEQTFSKQLGSETAVQFLRPLSPFGRHGDLMLVHCTFVENFIKNSEKGTTMDKMSPPNPHDHVGHFESFISRFIPPFNPTRGSATVRSFFDFSHPFSCALLRASEKCWLMIGFWDGHLHKQCYQCCFKEANKHRIPIQLLSKCNFSQNKKHVFTWTLASEIWKFHPSFWDVFTNLSKKWNRNLPKQLNWLNFCAFSRLSFFSQPFLNN